MIKPKLEDLPSSIQEDFLWGCDLDYCRYESSKAEAVHDILCNYPYKGSTNDLIIQSSYERVSAETVAGWLKAHISAARSSIVSLQEMLDNMGQDN